MTLTNLFEVARALVAPPKGLLAADESTGTANKRFASLGIPQTEEMRRRYRQMLFTTPHIERYINGVILYDETIRQRADDGRSFVEVLQAAGIVPGIKVDKGTVPLPFHPGEKITEGLDGLAARVAEYVALGAKFAKWRALFEIAPSSLGRTTPTTYGLTANAHVLARYAAICQEGGLVPIVEPEVAMDGDHDHGFARSREVHEQVLSAVLTELERAGVVLSQMVLKPSMVLPGLRSTERPSAREIAEATVEVLMQCVPPAVAGIAFLSGGQSPAEATERLQEIHVFGNAEGTPWPLTFSYSRALQGDAMRIWSRGESATRGEAAARREGSTPGEGSTAAAQQTFAERAALVSQAAAGIYVPEAEETIHAGLVT